MSTTYWNDDERSLDLKMMPTYDVTYDNFEEEYIPIYRILKEMYDEEKEKLYVDSNNLYYPYNYNYNSNDDNWLLDSYQWDRYSWSDTYSCCEDIDENDQESEDSYNPIEADDKAYHEDSMMYKDVYYV